MKKILIILLTMILYGCAGDSSHRDIHSLYLHMLSEPGTLNPVIATDAYESAINRNIYESLIDRDYDSLDFRPQLAERWEISADKLRYRFYLRKNVTWSDGKPFTADDILYSFKVIKDPKTANAHLKVYFIDIQAVHKINDYTVEFVYSRPYFMGFEICGSIPIVPKHIFNDGTDFNTHKNNRLPVGTGPFKFERWETGKNVVLVSNQSYWGVKPDVKRIVFRFIPEINIALQMLKKGDLDAINVRPIQWIRQTNSKKFESSFYKEKYYLPSMSYIAWNAKNDLFSDRRVRLAMTHLINREAILEKSLFGLGKIVSGTFYIFSKSYNQNIKPWPFDPEKGKALLKEAGWTDKDGDGILDKNGKKFSFTFTIASSSKFAERLATILKEDLARVGIEMNIMKYEWAVFIEKIQKRQFDAVSLGWSLGYNSDPYQLWHSSQAQSGSNFTSFKNAEVDRLIESARSEFNESARIAMYHRIHEILHYEQPYTFLYCSPAMEAVSKRFDNVKVHVRGLNYHEWTVRLQQ